MNYKHLPIVHYGIFTYSAKIPHVNVCDAYVHDSSAEMRVLDCISGSPIPKNTTLALHLVRFPKNHKSFQINLLHQMILLETVVTLLHFTADFHHSGKKEQMTGIEIFGCVKYDDHTAQITKFSDSAGYVGFANLPNQVHRKSVKKGFEFTLMVVGESGLGKSTLINSLFLTDLYPERYIPGAAEKIERTVQIEASTVEIEERGVKLRLTVVDTPGYGDAINSQDCFKTIIQYIDNQFERYLHDESGLNRRHIIDNRVHCCFYFISPFGHGLKPLDVEFMKALHGKVNIVPVIAKADTLTLKERERLKRRVLDEIAEHGIRIYQLPDADSDEDEEFKEQTRVLKASIPFAVIGSNQLIEVKGKKIRGRLYPWGVVEVENPEHNDFLKLRTMLVTHMQDLQEVTQDLHYENFRSERLKRTGKPVEEEVMDKDMILLQKEAEKLNGMNTFQKKGQLNV
ncbi:septin-2A [Gastrophryne carolinensis]